MNFWTYRALENAWKSIKRGLVIGCAVGIGMALGAVTAYTYALAQLQQIVTALSSPTFFP